MLLIHQHLHVMCEVCSEFLSSSEATCQLSESAQCLELEISEMGHTHVHFIRPVAPTPRSEPSELQNLQRNLAVGLPQEMSKREQNVIVVWLSWL